MRWKSSCVATFAVRFQYEKYQNRGLPLIDLIGEGNVGTHDRRAQVRSGSRHQSSSRTPSGGFTRPSCRPRSAGPHGPASRSIARQMLSRVIKAIAMLREAHARARGEGDLARHWHLDRGQLGALASLGASDVRLDATIGKDSDRALIERFSVKRGRAPRDADYSDRFRRTRWSALLTLPPRDAKIFATLALRARRIASTLDEIGRDARRDARARASARDRALKRASTRSRRRRAEGSLRPPSRRGNQGNKALSFPAQCLRAPSPSSSPAGSYTDAARAAIANGADAAIYLGAERFNARDDGAQLTLEELDQACRLAHSRGARVYLTLNTLIKPAELEDALALLGECIPIGASTRSSCRTSDLVRLIRRVYFPRARDTAPRR